LCIHKGSIFWVRRPLLGGFSKEREGALGHYLDVYEVLEKFGLAKEIRITFHGIGNL